MPIVANVGTLNPRSRRLNFERDGSASSTIEARIASAISWTISTSFSCAGEMLCGAGARSCSTKSSPNKTAMPPASSHVQKPLKLSFGQRVGQTGEIAEVESFTTKLRR